MNQYISENSNPDFVPAPSFQAPSPTPQAKHNYKFFLVFVLGSLAIFLLALGLWGLITVEKRQALPKESMLTEIQSESNFPIQTEVPQPTALVFQRDSELWEVTATGVKQLSQTGQKVVQHAVSKDLSKVAYIVIERRTNEGYTYFLKNEVKLFNADTNTHETIFTMQPSYHPENSEYVYQIQDLGFSGDNNLLAITTSDGLLIYDLKTKNLNEIFKRPYEGGKKVSGIFRYTQPQFSPDNNHLSLTVGYYEGSDSGVVDVKNKTIDILNWLNGPGGGRRILTWVNNNQFLVFDNMEDLIDRPAFPDYLLVDYPNLTETIISEKPDLGFLHQLFILDAQRAWALVYKIEDLPPYQQKFAKIYDFDWGSGQGREIFSTKVSDYQEVNRIFHSPQGELFVVSYSFDNETGSVNEALFSIDSEKGEMKALSD